MPTEPLTSAELTNIRQKADRFLAELMDEWYLHYAGHKDSLDIAEIYDRYPELTSLESAKALGASVDGDRTVRELWRFALLGVYRQPHAEQAEQIAALEAS